MRPIGGYFELELPKLQEYHSDALRLNTGRNCLEYILRCREYRKVYIPYYTCEVVLEPFNKLGVEYSFYHIGTNFELAEEISLKEGDALLYTNYFGLKQAYLLKLTDRYGKQLIFDNTQAFYALPLRGTDTFYTCRKFFGVPDGAYLYTDAEVDFDTDIDYSYDRMSFLVKRIDLSAEEGYEDFRKQSSALVNNEIRRMSKLTKRMMESINYAKAAQRRMENYHYLDAALNGTNQLNFPTGYGDIPMVYPYMTDNESLRKALIENKIFVATYWPNVLEWCNESDLEYGFAKRILPLPIDQRYNEEDMKRIIKTIKNYES